MKRFCLSACALIGLLLCALAPVWCAEPAVRRFDFGDATAAPDYVAVEPTLRFSPQRGYGWLETKGLGMRDRLRPESAGRDFVMGGGPATFRIAGLKPGRYRLTVVSGDMDYGDHVTRVKVAGTALSLPVMAPAFTEFTTLTATIAVTGPLDITFDSPNNNWVVNALSLEPAAADTPPSVARQEIKQQAIDMDKKEPDSLPAYLPEIRFHLTARPWQPVNTPESEEFDRLEAAVRSLSPFQHWNESDPRDVKNGALIDPYTGKEIQYATPLFSFNVAALLSAGRAADLATYGVRALDRATRDISDGKANDYHGEFFAAAMVKALRIYESLQAKYPQQITAERLKIWKGRMKTPRTVFMDLKVRQNWRTFAMKGEWLRQQDGYISDGVRWNEANWLSKVEGGQRERFREDLDRYGMKPHFFLYHDHGADPETFAYNGATTANLLDMLENGYDGPSAREMRAIIERALRSSLLLLGGSGEAAAGGRTGEHIWDDSVYAVGFEMMAEIAKRNGDLRGAGQFRRAALLLLRSHARFQQERGWFSITKNQFHSSLKHRYATWSGLTNYNGFTQTCVAEALLARKSEIPEQATPAEIGGYAATLDPSFSNVFLNAGGMQAQICTRGETDAYGGVQWHTLGITRFSRAGWESRLGPGAGHVNPDFSDGVSFSPVFLDNGKWTRVCLQPKRFRGSFRAEFVHPLLVRGTYTIAPLPGQSGPTFAMHVTLTPDGALVDTARTSGTEPFGVLWPLFEFDGRTVLNRNVAVSIASTAYPRAAGAAKVLPAKAATATGGALEWSGVDGGDGGATTIGFRYALGVDKSSMRRAKLFVNGVAQPDLVFLSTVAENDWHPLYVPVTLARGAKNVIRIESAEGQAGEGAIVDELRVHPAVASAPEPDQQNFIALHATHQLDASSPAVRGGYGDFRPIRVTDSRGGAVETFVYPRNAGDPEAESVRASFVRNGPDFSSVLGRVKGTLYVGRTAAGGEGKGIDLDNDGKDDVTFDQTCTFVLQLREGRAIAVEADRAVKAVIAGKEFQLAPFTPVALE